MYNIYIDLYVCTCINVYAYVVYLHVSLYKFEHVYVYHLSKVSKEICQHMWESSHFDSLTCNRDNEFADLMGEVCRTFVIFCLGQT